MNDVSLKAASGAKPAGAEDELTAAQMVRQMFNSIVGFKRAARAQNPRDGGESVTGLPSTPFGRLENRLDLGQVVDVVARHHGDEGFHRFFSPF